MKATLTLPRPWAQNEWGIPLQWTNRHPASHYGLGVLLIGSAVLDGATFRYLRDTLGARIVTDDPDRCRGALALPLSEWGIVNL